MHLWLLDLFPLSIVSYVEAVVEKQSLNCVERIAIKRVCHKLILIERYSCLIQLGNINIFLCEW
jgi:hypothetical protein